MAQVLSRRPAGRPRPAAQKSIKIHAGSVTLDGDLIVPRQAPGIVLFAHGSGSSRMSPRNRHVAEHLQRAGLATLLFDLMTRDEEDTDMVTGELRFDIGFLTGRLLAATRWVEEDKDLSQLRLGYFGASTGAAAALVAASRVPESVKAVVSRGGRPDLAGEALRSVRAPTLMIIGGDDEEVIGMNREAARQMSAPHDIEIIPGATHLFEEPGKLEEVARLAALWFTTHLAR